MILLEDFRAAVELHDADHEAPHEKLDQGLQNLQRFDGFAVAHRFVEGFLVNVRAQPNYPASLFQAQ